MLHRRQSIGSDNNWAYTEMYAIYTQKRVPENFVNQRFCASVCVRVLWRPLYTSNNRL